MHRIILLRVGGQKLHLLKMVGAFVVVGSALGVLGSISTMFRLVKQIGLAQLNPQLAVQTFGLTSETLTGDVALGLFMNPSAWFMFWLAFFIVGAMIYRSGNVIVPIEEEINTEKA